MRLAWDNKADGATVAASSQIATLPGSNVQQPHLSRKWQTAAAVKSAYLTLDMGAPTACSMLAVLGTNLTENATMRLRASPTSAACSADVTYDSGTIDAARKKVLSLPGSSGNYASTPDSLGISVTGDIDFRIKVTARNWTPPTSRRGLGGHWNATGNQRAWAFFVDTGSGNWQVDITPDGATVSSAAVAAPGFANGSTHWVRFTRGAASGTVRFYKSDDYDPIANTGTWTQVGADQATPAGALWNSTAALEVGRTTTGSSGGYWGGDVYYAELRAGINGLVVARFDPDADAAVDATSFRSSTTRELWTINQSGTPKAAIVDNAHANLKSGLPALYKQVSLAHLSLPGVLANYAKTPDSAAVSVTGDLDVRVKVSVPDWTPAAGMGLASKNGVAPQKSWLLYLSSAGLLQFYWSVDGTVLNTATSTVATGLTDGTTHWIRATIDVDNGAAGNDVKFYTSEDYNPSTGEGMWTQLGATVTTAGVTSICDGTAQLEVGGYNGGIEPVRGQVYYFEMRNGIGGPVVAAFDPSRAAASGATTFTAATGEVWTINQSGDPKAELLIDDEVTARYWRLDLTDNTVADNLHVGRVFLGPSWSYSETLQWGWGVTPVDPSAIRKSRGGQSYPDKLTKYRALDFTLNFLSEAQMFDNVFVADQANGRVTDMLAIPFESGSYVSEQAVWGLVSASEPVVHELTRKFRKKFRIEERL